MIFVSDHLIEVHSDLLQTYRCLGRDEYVRKESMRLNMLIAIKNRQDNKEYEQKTLF